MLEVGRIAARLGFNFDDRGADQWVRRKRHLEHEARDDIVADAKLDVDHRGFDRYGRDLDTADRHTDQLHRSTGKLRGGIGALGKGVGIAGAALAGGLAIGAKKAWTEFEEAAKIGAQTRAVIESTGGAAGVSAKEVEKLAGALSVKAGIDDEVVQQGSNMLLTFKNIRNEAGAGNDVFSQANKTLIDMSVALGKEPRTAAIALGKALNDPIKGITALSRVGVQFTDKQKEQITTLVESGKTMDAQKIILRELNSEFGGSAEAQARPLDRAKVAVMNLFEAIGTRLAPVVEDAADFLADFTEGLVEGKGAAGGFADFIGRVADGLKGLGRFLGDVFDLIRGGDQGTRRFGKNANDTFASIRRTVVQTFNTIKGSVNDVREAFRGAGDSFKIVGRAIGTAIQFAHAIVRRTLPGIRQMIGGLATALRGVVDIIAGILTLDFGRAWEGAKRLVGGAVRAIIGWLRIMTSPFREVFARIGGFVGRGASRVVGALGDMASDGARAAGRFVSGIVRRVRDLPGDMWRWLRRAAGRVADFGSDAARDAARGARRLVTAYIDRVKDLPGDLWHWLVGALDRLGDFERKAGKAALNAGQDIVNGLIDKVKQVPDKVFDHLKAVPGKIGSALKGTGKAIVGALGSAVDMGKQIANAVVDLLNAAIPNSIPIPGPAPNIDLPNNPIKHLARGGRVGPRSGGARIFVAGEGLEDEWVISQEGDRQRNVRWAVEALETLTGRDVALHRAGTGARAAAAKRKKKKRAAPSAESLYFTQQGALLDTDKAIATWEHKLGLLDRDYARLERVHSWTDEEFVVDNGDGTYTINQDAITQRVNEIQQLIDHLKEKTRKALEEYRTAVGEGASLYRSLARKMASAMRRIQRNSGKYSNGREAIDDYASKYEEFTAHAQDLEFLGETIGYDIGDVDISVKELENEQGAVRGTTAPASTTTPPTDTTPTDTTPPTDDTPPPADTPAPPSPEQIATEAAAQLAVFVASRQELLRSFGGNFREGGIPFGSSALDQAGGVRAFGAAGRGDDGAGGTTINIVNNFDRGPGEAHGWTHDQAYQAEAKWS